MLFMFDLEGCVVWMKLGEIEFVEFDVILIEVIFFYCDKGIFDELFI